MITETIPPSLCPAPSEALAAEAFHHEVRQTLRLTGVPRALLRLAPTPSLLARGWQAARPNVETRAFEEGADHLRERAVHAAAGLDRLSVLGLAQLGESQAFQAEAALMLAHYLDPKLLLLASAFALALEGPAAQGGSRGRGSADLIERGAPPRMPPLEHADEHDAAPDARKALRELKRAFGLAEAPQDFLTLALWPRYLCAAWQRLKPVAKTPGFAQLPERLRELSREQARALPHAWSLALPDGDAAAWLASTRELERELAALTSVTALLVLDWQAPELARRSPYPAAPRPRPEAL